MRFLPTITISALAVGLIGFAAAEAPRKQGLSRYSMLWTNSPFTVKPVETQQEAVNPLSDWALGGVSEVNGGYYLILLNRKKPAETEVVEPGVESAFKVLSVRRDPVDYLKTQVQVSYHGQSGWVSYDEKLLTLAKGPSGGNQPPGGAPNAGGQQQPPGFPTSGQGGGAGGVPSPNVPGMSHTGGSAHTGGGSARGPGGGGGGGNQQQGQGQPRPRQRIIAPNR